MQEVTSSVEPEPATQRDSSSQQYFASATMEAWLGQLQGEPIRFSDPSKATLIYDIFNPAKSKTGTSEGAPDVAEVEKPEPSFEGIEFSALEFELQLRVEMLYRYENRSAPDRFTWSDLRSFYKKLIRKHHPDLHMQASEQVKSFHRQRFLEVRESFADLETRFRELGLMEEQRAKAA